MALVRVTVRLGRRSRRGGSNELLERFLAGHANDHTRRAYRADLEDFARIRNRAPAEAIAELLAGPQEGVELVKAMNEELELHQTKLSVVFAYGRKPDRL